MRYLYRKKNRHTHGHRKNWGEGKSGKVGKMGSEKGGNEWVMSIGLALFGVIRCRKTRKEITVLEH